VHVHGPTFVEPATFGPTDFGKPIEIGRTPASEPAKRKLVIVAKSISRHQCVVRFSSERTTIEALASNSHVYVNMVRVPTQVRVPLADGSLVSLSGPAAHVAGDRLESARDACVTFRFVVDRVRPHGSVPGAGEARGSLAATSGTLGSPAAPSAAAGADRRGAVEGGSTGGGSNDNVSNGGVSNGDASGGASDVSGGVSSSSNRSSSDVKRSEPASELEATVAAASDRLAQLAQMLRAHFPQLLSTTSVLKELGKTTRDLRSGSAQEQAAKRKANSRSGPSLNTLRTRIAAAKRDLNEAKSKLRHIQSQADATKKRTKQSQAAAAASSGGAGPAPPPVVGALVGPGMPAPATDVEADGSGASATPTTAAAASSSSLVFSGGAGGAVGGGAVAKAADSGKGKAKADVAHDGDEDEDEDEDEAQTCVICLDLIDNPVLTECSHIFCEECITEHLRHAQGAARVCPTCREPLVAGGTNVALY
jgi:hypothetical protein